MSHFECTVNELQEVQPKIFFPILNVRMCKCTVANGLEKEKYKKKVFKRF